MQQAVQVHFYTKDLSAIQTFRASTGCNVSFMKRGKKKGCGGQDDEWNEACPTFIKDGGRLHFYQP